MEPTMALRQLLYVSTSDPAAGPVDVARIIEQSRHNNAIDGVTGLLWTDGTRFLQVLEGPADSIAATFARIGRDARHRDVVVLQDVEIEARRFGSWSMEKRAAVDSAAAFDARIARVLERASDPVRQTFLGLIAAQE